MISGLSLHLEIPSFVTWVSLLHNLYFPHHLDIIKSFLFFVLISVFSEKRLLHFQNTVSLSQSIFIWLLIMLFVLNIAFHSFAENEGIVQRGLKLMTLTMPMHMGCRLCVILTAIKQLLRVVS